MIHRHLVAWSISLIYTKSEMSALKIAVYKVWCLLIWRPESLRFNHGLHLPLHVLNKESNVMLRQNNFIQSVWHKGPASMTVSWTRRERIPIFFHLIPHIIEEVYIRHTIGLTLARSDSHSWTMWESLMEAGRVGTGYNDLQTPMQSAGLD
jgi:hypothetical protein